MYSVDNRESFEEIKRLQEQIWESKGISKERPRKRRIVPMVFVGNKADKESKRVIGTDELITLAEGIPGSGCVETSAKKNHNIEEIFLKLFVLAQLPTEMSPSLHRKVQPTYVGNSTSSGGSFRRGVTIRRRLSDACGAIAPNPRRPSIRTDLLILQTKKNADDGNDDKMSLKSFTSETAKCIIQ